MAETLSRLELTNFTAFRSLDVVFSPGVNVFIGANGTGKTHLLKLLYSACDITRTGKSFGDKVVDVFLPYQGRIGRLSHRSTVSVSTEIVLHRGQKRLVARFSNHTQKGSRVDEIGRTEWNRRVTQSAYIPVKEMLAHAPGFRSLYADRHIEFEETYFDLIDRAFLPRLRGPVDLERRRLLRIVENAIEGKVITKGEVFFLRNAQGELEFSLLAEGIRKLALLWLLVQNGTLTNGTALFWDEPEANLNPRAMRAVVEILLELSRRGVQVFVATHDYVILKEFDLQKQPSDDIKYHALYREDGDVRLGSTSDYLQIHPNSIAETFVDLYDRDVARALGMGNSR